MAHFDADIRRALQDTKEVRIRTEKHPESAVVIWVVAAGEDVFVRSFRGDKGRWYRDLAEGGEATLEVGGRHLPVQATSAKDPASIERASAAFLAKYGPSPYAEAMVKPEVLGTTLRLDPR
ncbi:MAG: DUF2255 family protein [Alphaproteobacteria bacterium]|nr:DUF2255 family protein [Alphaproteobacteria bacterium]